MTRTTLRDLTTWLYLVVTSVTLHGHHIYATTGKGGLVSMFSSKSSSIWPRSLMTATDLCQRMEKGPLIFLCGKRRSDWGSGCSIGIITWLLLSAWMMLLHIS